MKQWDEKMPDMTRFAGLSQDLPEFSLYIFHFADFFKKAKKCSDFLRFFIYFAIYLCYYNSI